MIEFQRTAPLQYWESGPVNVQTSGEPNSDAARSTTSSRLVAKAMSHDTRVRILMAMNTPRRRMSPREFAEEAELPVGHSAYHFRQLRDAGCIELVETRQSRGATEHFYEPLERALAWTEEWSQFSPHTKRVILRSVMGGAVKALGSAIDQGAFEDRCETCLAWDTVMLDMDSWLTINKILDLAVRELLQLEEDCRTRIEAGADYFLATYCLASFESPRKDDPFSSLPDDAEAPTKRRLTQGRAKRKALKQDLSEREMIARAMSHPTRVRILMAMNTPRRRMSPKLFAAESGLPRGHCAYHFRELEDYGCISLVALIPRKAATETIFEARKQALQWTEDWTLLGPVVKQNVVVPVMRGAVEALAFAIEGGTFEAREDSHLAWSTIRVDEEGWRKMDTILDTALKALMGIGREVADRATMDAGRFPGSYLMASFESPNERG